MDHGHSHEHDLDVKKIEHLSSTQVRLTIAFSSESVQKHERSTAQRYLQQARIPGFRPGKAPLKMIMDRFKEDIRKDVVQHFLEAGLWEAVEKTKLNPVSRPQIKLEGTSLEDGKPFEFQAEFEIQPEIPLNSYKGVPLAASDFEPSDEELTTTLDGLRDRMSVLEPVEAETPTNGQFAVVEVGFELTGTESKSEAPRNFTVEVGADKLLPDIDKALLEMKVGESRKVTTTFPGEYDDKNLAGKEATFDIKLVEIKKKNLPELNDAFAAQLKEGSTLETLRTDIRESLRQNKKEDTEKAQRQQIVDYLIQHNRFDVPASMVERQSQTLMESMLQDMKRQGKAFPELPQEQMQQVKQSAEQMVRSSLLLREIAEKEQIALDEARVQERIDAIAKQIQRTVPETEKFLNGKGIMDQIRNEILTDQVFEFLIQNAEVKTESAKA